jgi:hypothetical protein
MFFKVQHAKVEKMFRMTAKYTKPTATYTIYSQNIPDIRKIYQITAKYTRYSQNIPNNSKIHQNNHNIYHIDIKYTHFSHSKSTQNVTKSVVFVCRNASRQPASEVWLSESNLFLISLCWTMAGFACSRHSLQASTVSSNQTVHSFNHCQGDRMSFGKQCPKWSQARFFVKLYT